MVTVPKEYRVSQTSGAVLIRGGRVTVVRDAPDNAAGQRVVVRSTVTERAYLVAVRDLTAA